MKIKEKYIRISLVIITVMMTILRFLLNEKGRVTPDSIRYMRFAHGLPVIDNTTTPLGYPVAIRLLTYLGPDEFWSSKIIGICSFFMIIFWARKRNFYYRESIVTGALFSFLSIFSATLSEALILPFVFFFFYIAALVIREDLKGRKAFLYLSLILILLYNIRYSALFFIGAAGLFGLLHLRKKYSPVLLFSAATAGLYVVAYKLLFIDHFNEDYIRNALETGLHPTSQLLTELFQALCTTFNPFIHMASPGGGMINYAIYGLGLFNIILMVFTFIRYRLSDSESFFVFTGVAGILCMFFIQYFYSLDPLDYRLLAPFSFPLWLVYFRKLFFLFKAKVYIIAALSLLSGLCFTWLSKGSYLENRKRITRFLKSENLDKAALKFYWEPSGDSDKMQVSELVSTVNPQIIFTRNPKDTLQKTTLTGYKVLQKIKIDKNKYQ